MRKSLSRALLITILVGGLILASNVHFDTVKAATDVTGIINSDITWTKANSPYSLTGPMLVSNGVTLTIEPGVTVYLNEHYIRVNGTLVARGSSTDKIHFEISSIPGHYLGTQIEFTSFSTNWNEQTGSGCIIENAIVNSALSISNSPKINNNSIDARILITGSSAVTISNNNITDEIIIDEASPVISNNKITSQIDYGTAIDIAGGSTVISNNSITGYGMVGNIGISIQGDNHVYVSYNTISGFRSHGIRAAGASTIERNSIFGNNYGIGIGMSVAAGQLVIGEYSEIIIRNNTIEDNSYGIYGLTPASTIIYNNIQNNSIYNVGLRRGDNVNATYNWWGTTDTQAINQTIFDFKNDFNLGTVTFIPFLTEPNPEEMSTPIPEFPSSIILPLLLVATVLIMLCKKRLTKNKQHLMHA